MPEKIINIDGVGNVLFKHSNRARHLNISVRPFAGVRVSIPVGMSYKVLVRLITEKNVWIKKHLDKMKEFEEMQTQFDENSGYCTKYHQAILKKGETEKIFL